MNYKLLHDTLNLVEEFERENQEGKFEDSINGFKKWIIGDNNVTNVIEPNWEGKENGRSAESVINTLIVHMNRYAKNYSKAAMFDSEFSTQEEFIYLINLKAFGAMSKTDLIKKNIHDKPAGIKIINRLIDNEWVEQKSSELDKRSKVIAITNKGLNVLENQMEKIRQATLIVTGNLNHQEKMQLIVLLEKLNQFHHPIYSKNYQSKDLLTEALQLIS